MDTFDTPDMTLATYLRIKGHPPVEVSMVGRRCIWHFEDSAEVEQLIVSYQYREAMVDASEFSEAYKETLNEMHDAKRSAGV